MKNEEKKSSSYNVYALWVSFLVSFIHSFSYLPNDSYSYTPHVSVYLY